MAEIRDETVHQHVIEYLESQKTLTLASASPTGVPHAATFMFVNTGPILYFWTRPEGTTSKHVEQNPIVSFAIDTYAEDFSKTQGVLGAGECRTVLNASEITRVVKLFAEKYPDVGSSGGQTTGISFFRITPTQVQFID